MSNKFPNLRTPAQILELILERRGINPANLAVFLNPDFESETHDPFLLPDMEKAVDRIILALEKGQRIGVFGDYDADGVPATALIVRVMRQLGVEVKAYIPSRSAGYGLTSKAVDQIIKDKIELLIAVDNGTVAKNEFQQLKSTGIDGIICDHHEPDLEHLATAALAIINPKLEANIYPFRELCACALAWKLMHALYLKKGMPTDVLKWELDLVGLSTIADMVPLIGENRVLAKFGLKVMAKSRNLGIQALAEVSGTNLKNISAGSVGFRLAPRINAPSRMHQEEVNGENSALSLLTSMEKDEAQSLAHYLNEQNLERQELLENSLKEALQLAGEQISQNPICPFLVLFAGGWSTGVIGLMAGRLTEKYQRPVIVLALEGQEIKGSVRSVDGVSAVEMIASAQKVLAKFGGHQKAAGLTFILGEPSQLVADFRQLLEDWFKQENINLEYLKQNNQRKIMLDLSLSEATLELIESLSQLEPFGIGFAAPKFKVEGLVLGLRKLGKEQQHLSFMLDEAGVQRKVIAFNLAENFDYLALSQQKNKAVALNVSLQAEEWNGLRSPALQMLELINEP